MLFQEDLFQWPLMEITSNFTDQEYSVIADRTYH